MSTDDEKWFVTLGWALLEFRCMYFAPQLVHPSWCSALTIKDADYDRLEAEYLDLAIKLDHEPTATSGVEFDLDRPAEVLVLSKLKEPKGGHKGVIEADDLHKPSGRSSEARR